MTAKNKKKSVVKHAASKKAPVKKLKVKPMRSTIKKNKKTTVKTTLSKKNTAKSLVAAKKGRQKISPIQKAKISKIVKKHIKLVVPISKEAVKSFTGRKKKYYDLLMRVRNMLSNQVQTLSEDALLSGAATGEPSSAMTNHMADYGSDNFLHAMELDIMSGEMEEIEMIDEALDRLAGGEFGKCQDCGCKIPDARLEVKPYVRFCVKCKTEREKLAEDSDVER
jgi:DnaK suppressor protein